MTTRRFNLRGIPADEQPEAIGRILEALVDRTFADARRKFESDLLAAGVDVDQIDGALDFGDEKMAEARGPLLAAFRDDGSGTS